MDSVSIDYTTWVQDNCFIGLWINDILNSENFNLSIQVATIHMDCTGNDYHNNINYHESTNIREIIKEAAKANREFIFIVVPGVLVNAETYINIIPQLLKSPDKIIGQPYFFVSKVSTLFRNLPTLTKKFKELEITPNEIPLSCEIEIEEDSMEKNIIWLINERFQNWQGHAFLFNTEEYVHPKKHDPTIPNVDFQNYIMLPSGFQGPWLINQLNRDGDLSNKKIVFYDTNYDAILMRQTQLEDWDGRDFMHWYKKQTSRETTCKIERAIHTTFYDLLIRNNYLHNKSKDLDIAEHLWKLELEKWDSEETFIEAWQRLREQRDKILYVHCNIETDFDKIKYLMKFLNDGPSFMWTSNVFWNTYNLTYSKDPNSQHNNYKNFLNCLKPEFYVYTSIYPKRFVSKT